MLKVIDVLRTMLRVPVADLENDYLKGAEDRYDLEFRQRQIDNGLFRRALGGFY
ncbi:DUF3563 domain-containing protein [Gemmobacter serpentinus]|uniref:DUF3563 domain-containing protein n=1 Tax=Gemmobacter serpentinus TaxID=2652247 RepID=UPI00124E513D|nr:DUF3563 domain-containing protein [Gemmobacter serpentinus]